ncbi:MAG: nodulation protein NfeD [Syntrophotaleaceae bacterium]
MIFKYLPIFIMALCLLATGALRSAAAEPPSADSIRAVRITGVISPTIADFITKQLEEANRLGQKGFLLELDTPGGLDTAMRSIIQAMLGSRTPVIVYVAPSGARAASAGALITLAADFAAMAPGTNLGAAHPVAIGAGEKEGESAMMSKVVEDAVAYARSIAQQRGRNVEWAEQIVRKSISTPAEEALKQKVIDLIAENEQELKTKLDGRVYQRGGQEFVLKTTGVELEFMEMNWRQKILQTISHPNIAYMLMMLGILGIFFEISQPGSIFPGAIGAIALLLALFAFQALPVNYVGMLYILLAVVLFILEVKVVSYGLLTIGGILSLTLGSLMLMEDTNPYMRISWPVIAATVAVTSALFLLVLSFVVRTQKKRFVSGAEGMAGEQGKAVTDIDGEGRVFVHGEYWNAFSRERISEGETVEVIRLGEKMRLEVKKAEPPP